MTVHETNCIIKLSTWPATGTTVDNEGSAGSAYDATIYYEGNTTTPTSHTAKSCAANWNDWIDIPTGTANSNYNLRTWEFVFKPTSDWGAYASNFWQKDVATGQILLLFSNAYIYIIRYNAAHTAYRRYYARVADYYKEFTNGNWYDVQITWDCSTAYNNAPVCRVNDTAIGLGNQSGTVTDWGDDSGGDEVLGYSVGDGYTVDIALYREHTAVLTTQELSDNYAVDSAAIWLGSADVTVALTTVPGATADDCASTAQLTIAGTVPGATADDAVLTPNFTIAGTVPGATADDVAPLPVFTIAGTVPGATADDVIVTPTNSSTIALTTVPGATADDLAITPTNDSTISMTVPGATADDVAPLPVFTIAGTVPGATADDVAPLPVFTIAGTVPGATADDCAITPTNDSTISMTVPGATADDLAVTPTNDSTISMTVPGATADDCAVTATTESVVTVVLSTVPGATADDVAVTPTNSSVISMTVPGATADDVIVTPTNSSVISMTVPGATADDLAMGIIETIAVPMPQATADDLALTTGLTILMTYPGATADDCAAAVVNSSVKTIEMTCPGAVADDEPMTVSAIGNRAYTVPTSWFRELNPRYRTDRQFTPRIPRGFGRERSAPSRRRR